MLKILIRKRRLDYNLGGDAVKPCDADASELSLGAHRIHVSVFLSCGRTAETI